MLDQEKRVTTEFIKNTKDLGIELSDEQIRLFFDFYNLLIEENKITNLTRITDINDVYNFHFYDSLNVRRALDEIENIKLLDVGSGPGFPATPLKIAFPSIDLTVIEATNKKVEFIKKSALKLGIEKIRVIHTRAEDFSELNTYDYVTTRAVSTINEQLPYTIPFLKVHGKLIAMKGSLKALDELNEAKPLLNSIGAKVSKIIDYTVLDRNYCLVVIEKIKETPKKYPKAIHKKVK